MNKFYIKTALRYSIYAHLLLVLVAMSVLCLLGMRFLYWVIIIFTLMIILLEIYHRKHSSSYSANAEHSEWYAEQIHYYGTDWCALFIDEITSMLPSDWCLVSPASNSAIFEKTCFDYAASTQKVTFVCSDLAPLTHTEKSCISGESVFQYIEEKNALMLSTYLQFPANVILDRKGALWYMKRDPHTLKKLIQAYYECLTQNGFLIIDNNPSNFFLNQLSTFLYFLLYPYRYFRENPIMRRECSTLQRLKKHKHILQEYFEEEKEIVLPTKHCSLKFKIYRKRY